MDGTRRVIPSIRHSPQKSTCPVEVDSEAFPGTNLIMLQHSGRDAARNPLYGVHPPTQDSGNSDRVYTAGQAGTVCRILLTCPSPHPYEPPYVHTVLPTVGPMDPREALRGGISKSILQRPCQFLAINAHKMAPRTIYGSKNDHGMPTRRAYGSFTSGLLKNPCEVSSVNTHARKRTLYP